ncbi:MAG: S41 family peptidase [Trueperaceae bacterium]|nr:S41 family peptidase [Trueperaceae bacterium]
MTRSARVAPTATVGALRRALALLLAVVVAIGIGTGHGSEGGEVTLPSDADWTRSESARGRLFDRVAQRVEQVYWDPDRVDWASWRAAHRRDVVVADGRVALDAAFRRAFDGLGDGHSRWIGRSPEPNGRDRPVAPTSPVDLGVEAIPLDQRGLLVTRVHPGAAADIAGMRRGDVIERANGRSLSEPGLRWAMQDRIAEALRSGVATLELERPGHGRVRLEVRPADVPAGARQRPIGTLDRASGVARLELPAFVTGSAQAAHEEVARLKDAGADALVVDLRGNPGGGVLEMGLVLALFMEGGPVAAWTRGGPDWILEIERDDGGATARLVARSGSSPGRDVAVARIAEAAVWDGPVAVLVDEGSASAAEATAAVLATVRSAPVVGADTPGNVESVRRVSFVGGHEAWVAVGDLRFDDGTPLAPVEVDAEARLDPIELARGHDAPFAEAVRRLRALPWTPGRWF